MKKIFLIIPLALVLLVSCDREEFNSDNSIAVVEYPLANIASLKEAPYPIGGALTPNNLKNNAAYKQTVINEMTSMTSENAMKMANISRGRKQYFWDDVDYLVNFGIENKMRVHGHTLIWHNSTPAWITSFVGTKEDWKLIMKEYIQDVVGRYKGKIKSWDVVNEVIDDNGVLRESVWKKNIGEEFIALAFQYAHEADPDAILFYNEYGHEYSAARRLAVYQLAMKLKAENVPINGLGLQMHVPVTRSEADIRYAIFSAAKTGFKIHVSELDVALNPSLNKSFVLTNELLQQQKDVYRYAAKAMMELPVEQQYGITFWGVADPNSFLSSGPDFPAVFDFTYKRKPAYDGLLQGFYKK